MRVYYDAEFLEDGKTIELVSIGMVREDGREYYAVNAEMDFERVLEHEWLVENVVKHLPTTDGIHLNRNHPDVKLLEVIRSEVADFFLDACIDAGEKDIELWSWYAAYDHVALCQLWGPMISKPSCVPHYTNDIRQEFQRFGNPQHNIVSGNHNALVDAHYHKALHEFIMQIEKDQFEDEVRWRARRQAD